MTSSYNINDREFFDCINVEANHVVSAMHLLLLYLALVFYLKKYNCVLGHDTDLYNSITDEQVCKNIIQLYVGISQRSSFQY